jgi:hypothetical protein
MKTVKKMNMGGDGMMMKDTMMKKGGAVKGAKKQAATAIAMKAAGKKPKMEKGGALKDVPTSKVGLGKLPTEVRNKMGYKKYGGSTDPKMKMGGAAPKAKMGGATKYKMGGAMKGKKC